MRYVDFDTEKTWTEMMTAYVNAGGDILYPGDEKEMLLRAALAIATGIMAKVDTALKMDTLTYATGEYLKEYGLKRNCAYIEAVPATAVVEMNFKATGAAQTIEAGTELTADGMVAYATTEDISLTGGAQTVTSTIECRTAGTVGNGLTAGTQMQLVVYNEAFGTAVVTQSATGGTDAEDEEAYRERIRQHGLSSVTTGTAQQYESEAMAVSAHIIDAKAVNAGGGEVNVYLLMDEDANKNEIIGAVETALTDEATRPLTDHVTVHEATARAYTLETIVNYSPYAGIDDAIETAVKEYKAWQDNKIGRAFNPDKLVAMLYQAGCERVRFSSTSGMNGSTEYTEIGAGEHCEGTIEIELRAES